MSKNYKQPVPAAPEMVETTKTGEPSISYAEATRRVRAGMRGAPFLQAQVADLIWPNHRMTRQGAALAAGPFISRMAEDGQIMWLVATKKGIGDV